MRAATHKQPTRQTTVHVRWCIRRDTPEIMAIEQDAFGAAAWDETRFIDHLRSRNCICLVAEHPKAGLILGYMIYELHKWWFSLTRLAVSPWWWRAGIGSQLVAKLQAKCGRQRPVIDAIVTDENIELLCLLRSRGFKAVDCRESIVTMTWTHEEQR